MGNEQASAFIAVGGSPTPGFVCEGIGYIDGADIAGQAIGVKGTATGDQNGNGDGVQGHGAGGYSGVAGFGAPTGTGVFGLGGGTAPGVRGIGGGGPNTGPPPTNAVGVYGQGGEGNSDGVQGVGSGTYSGVAGFGGPNNGTGVFGLGGGNGPGVRGMGGPNGGVPIMAVSTGAAHIRMNPVSLGANNPNSAGVPGTPGDLLAVSTDAGVQLWFNTGGTGGWTVVL